MVTPFNFKLIKTELLAEHLHNGVGEGVSEEDNHGTKSSILN